MSEKGAVKYYVLRKYKEYKNYNLDQLKELYEKIQKGEVSLKGKEMYVSGRKSHSIKENVDNPEENTELVKELGVSRFIVEAKKDTTIALAIKKNQEDIKFFRMLYSNTTLTLKEVAFLLDEKETSMRYYAKKYGIVKMPSSVLKKIKNVEQLKEFITKPLPQMVSVPTDETSEEFKERYNVLGYKIFKKLESLSLDPSSDPDDIKKLNVAVNTLNNNMKLELEAKNLVVTVKEKEFRLKEKELDKNSNAITILDFGDDIDKQEKIFDVKEKLEAEGMEEDKIEEVLRIMFGG